MTKQNNAIHELRKILSGKPYYMNDRECDLLAEFIIEDRNKILQPLVDGYLRPDFPKMSMNGQLNTLCNAVVKTLKNAGV